MVHYILGITKRNTKFDVNKYKHPKIMKKLLLAILFTVLLIPASYSQFTKIGASLGYNYRYYFNNESDPVSAASHKLKNPILSFNAVYEINLPVHIVPRLNIYFPNIGTSEEVTGSPVKTSLIGFSADIDGHYVFNYFDDFEIYGLAGLNILYARKKLVQDLNEEVYTDKSSTTELGLNLGVGTYWKIKDEFDLFAEAKVSLANQIQVVATAGILINMEYLKNKEGRESGY